ncbi:uncharacterized protein LACBIDRAFT_306774 [Laccaria bicolor S238N-H82]|uniref:Predicted protein n=1 Tax=Laccaria bicolor (strain S238N-H82 / ATCC MYA-4686) TaxID=486041 RepID=B0DNN7_LACBS|nr:uncharacterized protein LACBIDRAFT_306774 [Laccaria bicolor S238N-H82]EDR03686.1 predicted protein [Laccaria bicolor S238N-H82]|eukprot:XP_001885539.1 predicted protein [Laccaria bicolor S238N-H82]
MIITLARRHYLIMKMVSEGIYIYYQSSGRAKISSSLTFNVDITGYMNSGRSSSFEQGI